MSLIDITQHFDDKLSVIVFHTHELYSLRGDQTALTEALMSKYKYTNKQYAVLIEDLIDDLFHRTWS